MNAPSYPSPAAPEPPPSAPSGPTQSSGQALAALILGIVSIIGGSVLLIPPILAIVFGHKALNQCSKNPALSGKGQAIAGLVLGYVSLAMAFVFALLAVMAIPAFNKVRESSQHKAVINNARMLSMAADQYYLENGVSIVRFNDLIGPDKYIKTFASVAGERYPERYTQGVTITIQGVAGSRTVTYEP